MTDREKLDRITDGIIGDAIEVHRAQERNRQNGE